MADGAVIDNLGSFTLTHAGNQTMAIQGNGTFNNYGTFSYSSSSANESTTVDVAFNNTGNVIVQNSLTIGGLFTWTGGTLSGGGSLTAQGGMNISGNVVLDGMTLINAASATLDNGDMSMADGATMNNPIGATIALDDGSIAGTGSGAPNRFENQGTIVENLHGAGAGQYGQILVNGAVSLAGALDLIPGAGFTSPVGSLMTIISGNPTTGTFPGYAEGSVVNLNGQPYTITYHGGTGNSVVLTHVGITDTTAAKSIPVSAGQPTGNQVLATFTDTYPNVSAANISGTINWGDNTSTAFTSSAVTLSGGTFSVSGSHTYATPGSYSVTVTINDGYGDTISTSRTQFTVAIVAGSIYVLDPTAGGALSLSGNASINTAGTVVVDSDSTSAILASGNATVTATGGVLVQNGVSNSGNAKVTKTGTPAATGDPLSGLVAPTIPTYTGTPVSESLGGNSSATISQGLYSQISVSGNAKLTLNPGVYVIGAGGVTVSGNASLSGSGVTYIIEGGGMTVSGNAGLSGTNVLIFNTTSGSTSGSITLSGNGTFSLSAASSGPDTGVLIFQPSANSKALSFSGNAMAGLTGTVFAPSAQLLLSGNAELKDTLVVDMLSMSGNAVAQLVASSGGTVYTPAQIRTAYGINDLALDGTGQTIAIVDAYDDPQIYQALDTFDGQFGLTTSGPTLYQQYGPATSFLTVLNQNGQATSLPGTDPVGPGNDNWEVEESLDVEWAHAIAPGAKIILVEADSQSLSDLMAGVATAAAEPGVSEVSMSWGFAEGQGITSGEEATYDGTFTTPGVTFVASTGDYGAADPVYPAFSPNVLAVGRYESHA